MSKTISLCGVERGDVAYYLAVILSHSTNLGSTVLVVDNSYSHDIYSAVTDEELDKEYVIKQNITYIKNALINKDYEGIFDYVIVWHGMNIREDILNNSDHIYVMPDYTRNSIKTIKEKISDFSIVDAIVLRDSVLMNKLSDQKIAEALGVKPELIKYTLIYDNKDYENYLAFLYNGRQTFGNLSPVFNEYMISLAGTILEINAKEANKIFKNAKTAQGNK